MNSLHQPAQVEAAPGRQPAALLWQLGTVCFGAACQAAVVQVFEEHPDAPVLTGSFGLDFRRRSASARSLRACVGSDQGERQGCKVMTRKVDNERSAAVGCVWAFVCLTKSPGARAWLHAEGTWVSSGGFTGLSWTA
ncbi:hypothetical protein AB0N07_43460 [Streptomyces sp. NPDC051172]|uniref:hypothetical protein n=1 Tax=Streptomyces sp. NPDC051172 TaxID=3155796 RepID=UPI003435D2D7